MRPNLVSFQVPDRQPNNTARLDWAILQKQRHPRKQQKCDKNGLIGDGNQNPQKSRQGQKSPPNAHNEPSPTKNTPFGASVPALYRYTPRLRQTPVALPLVYNITQRYGHSLYHFRCCSVSHYLWQIKIEHEEVCGKSLIHHQHDRSVTPSRCASLSRLWCREGPVQDMPVFCELPLH